MIDKAKVIRKLLQDKLQSMTPPITTVLQNEAVPVQPGQPFQKVAVLFAKPQNVEKGRLYREQGLLQVDLRYPLGKGMADVEARAGYVRDTFYKSLSLKDVETDIVVTVNATPELFESTPEDKTYKLVVRVSWHANMQA